MNTLGVGVQEDHSLATMWKIVLTPNCMVVLFFSIVLSCTTKTDLSLSQDCKFVGGVVEDLDGEKMAGSRVRGSHGAEDTCNGSSRME